jgi:hypothetical protein
MGQDDMFVVEFYAEHRIGQKLSDHAAELDHIFFGQINLIEWWRRIGERRRVRWAEIGRRSSFCESVIALSAITLSLFC